MNRILKTLAIIGLILIIAGMIASMHYSGLYQQSMLGMHQDGQELSAMKANIAAVYTYLRLTLLAQRTAMGGSILLALSLLSLLFAQDKRIRKIEKCQQAGAGYPPQGVGSPDP